MSDLFDAGFVWDEPNRIATHGDSIELVDTKRTTYEPPKTALPARTSIGSDTASKQADPVTVATVATVADWREGLATLHHLPCPEWCFPDRWKQLKADADWFAMSWAEDAFAAGWAVTDVFGCYRQPWYQRLDHDGLVTLLRGRSVTDLTATTATIKNPRTAPHTFRLHPGRSVGVPLWIGYAEAREA